MNLGKRRTAREMAVQMLYQSDLGGSPLPQIFRTFDLSEYLAREREEGDKEKKPAQSPEEQRAEAGRRRKRVDEAFEFAQELVKGTLEHRERIDDMIRGQADNWRLERMPAVDRNVLRLAIYEMLFEADTPKLVVVDEAIELAKKFGSEQSGRFVNGLLDGLLKQHTFPGSLT
ncbi:MAG: transcription antitermination factor NusB [Acidobacteriota bacterium]